MTTRILRRSLGAAAALSVALAALVGSGAQQRGPTQELPPVKSDQMDRWMKELSNWGRWGKDDQRGTLNLITPAKRLQALALPKSGVTLSLARPPLVRPKAEAPSTGAFLELNFWKLSRDFIMERQELSL